MNNVDSNTDRKDRIKERLLDIMSALFEKYLPLVSYIILVVSIVVMVTWPYISNFISIQYYLKLDSTLSEALVGDQSGTLMTVSVVLFGFYVTVMSVLGSSYSTAMVRISKEELSGNFIRYAVEALSFSFIFLITVTFINLLNIVGCMLVVVSIFLSMLINAVRFSFVVLTIYNTNIKNVSSEVEKKEDFYKNILDTLKKIDSKISNPEESLEYHMELVQKMREIEEKSAKKKYRRVGDKKD